MEAKKMERPCKKYERGICSEFDHCFNCARHLDGDSRCPRGCDTASEAERDEANNE